MEINPRLATTKRTLTQERWLDPRRDSELWAIVMVGTLPTALPSAPCSLWKLWPHIHSSSEHQSPVTHWMDKLIGAPRQFQFPDNRHYVTCLVTPWKGPVLGLFCHWAVWELLLWAQRCSHLRVTGGIPVGSMNRRDDSEQSCLPFILCAINTSNVSPR